MSIEHHIKQNTVTVFDAYVVEVQRCTVVESGGTLDEEILTCLKELNIEFLGTEELGLFKIAYLQTKCGCKQALLFIDEEAITSLDKSDKKDLFDPTAGFTFGGVEFFISSDDATVFLNEVEYRIPKEDIQSYVEFFSSLYSQETVRKHNELMEMAKEASHDIKTTIMKSNIANFPEDIHEYLIKVSYNKEANGSIISSDGKHYLNTDEEGIYKLYFPVIDSDASVSQLFSATQSLDKGDQINLLDSTMPGEYTRFSHREPDYSLIEDTYEGFTIYAISASPSFILENFNPELEPLANIVNMIK